MQSIIKDKISVIGLGKLGLPLSTLFAKNDVFVMGVDTNKDLVDKLNKKRIPFFETDLEKNLKLAHNNIEYTTSYNGIVEERAYRSPSAARKYMDKLVENDCDFTLLTHDQIRDTISHEMEYDDDYCKNGGC